MSTQCVGILPACKENWQFKTQFSSVQSLDVIPQRKVSSKVFHSREKTSKEKHCTALQQYKNITCTALDQGSWSQARDSRRMSYETAAILNQNLA